MAGEITPMKQGDPATMFHNGHRYPVVIERYDADRGDYIVRSKSGRTWRAASMWVRPRNAR